MPQGMSQWAYATSGGATRSNFSRTRSTSEGNVEGVCITLSLHRDDRPNLEAGCRRRAEPRRQAAGTGVQAPGLLLVDVEPDQRADARVLVETGRERVMDPGRLGAADLGRADLWQQQRPGRDCGDRRVRGIEHLAEAAPHGCTPVKLRPSVVDVQ